MVSITDLTTRQPIADQATVAGSYWSRFRGLMLRRSIAPGEALDIHPCGSIHMMFMLFPIDAIFYDANLRVTKVSRRVLPWIGLAFGGRGAKGVIELPVGAAAGVEPGHQVAITA